MADPMSENWMGYSKLDPANPENNDEREYAFRNHVDVPRNYKVDPKSGHMVPKTPHESAMYESDSDVAAMDKANEPARRWQAYQDWLKMRESSRYEDSNEYKYLMNESQGEALARNVANMSRGLQEWNDYAAKTGDYTAPLSPTAVDSWHYVYGSNGMPENLQKPVNTFMRLLPVPMQAPVASVVTGYTGRPEDNTPQAKEKRIKEDRPRPGDMEIVNPLWYTNAGNKHLSALDMLQDLRTKTSNGTYPESWYNPYYTPAVNPVDSDRMTVEFNPIDRQWHVAKVREDYRASGATIDPYKYIKDPAAMANAMRWRTRAYQDLEDRETGMSGTRMLPELARNVHDEQSYNRAREASHTYLDPEQMEEMGLAAAPWESYKAVGRDAANFGFDLLNLPRALGSSVPQLGVSLGGKALGAVTGYREPFRNGANWLNKYIRAPWDMVYHYPDKWQYAINKAALPQFNSPETFERLPNSWGDLQGWQNAARQTAGLSAEAIRNYYLFGGWPHDVNTAFMHGFSFSPVANAVNNMGRGLGNVIVGAPPPTGEENMPRVQNSIFKLDPQAPKLDPNGGPYKRTIGSGGRFGYSGATSKW